MKLFVVLVLSVLSAGCHANVLADRQLATVTDAFWEYVARATTTAEDSLMNIRQSELGQEVNSLIASSKDAVNKISDTFHTQMAPLSQDLMTKFSQEAELLKTRLGSAMETRLQPYAEQLAAELQTKVEALKKEASFYTETMDPESMKTILLQRSQEMKDQLDQGMSNMQKQMVPYTEEIREKMEQSLDEFQKSLVPLGQSFENLLTQKTEELQQRLAPYGEELQAKLDMDTTKLQQQLQALWKSFSKLSQ